MYYDNISHILRDGFGEREYKLMVNSQENIHQLTDEQFICVREDTCECKLNTVTMVLFDGREPITLDMLKAKQLELIDLKRFTVLRQFRNMLLKETDYLMTIDYPHPSEDIKNQWLVYRQALRDLPQTQNPQLNEQGELDLTSIVIPQKPL